MKKGMAYILLLVSILFSSVVYSNKQQNEVDFLDKVLDDKPASPQKVATDKQEKVNARKKHHQKKSSESEEEVPPIKHKLKTKVKKAKKAKVEDELQEENVLPKKTKQTPIKRGLKGLKNGYQNGNWIHEEFIVTPENLPKYEKNQSKEEPSISSTQEEQKSKILDIKPLKEKNIVPVITVDKKEDTIMGKFFLILSENKKVLIIFGLVTLFALYRWKYNTGKNAKTTFTRLKR